MTREQIEQQIRTDNPTTTDDRGRRHGPGAEVYEAAITRWVDAALAAAERAEQARAAAEAKAAARERVVHALDDDPGRLSTPQRLARLESLVADLSRMTLPH